MALIVQAPHAVATIKPMPEPYKVSTITATGSLNADMDLALLFDSIPILDPQDIDSNGFTFVEFGMKHGDVRYKGVHKKIAIAAKRQQQQPEQVQKKRRFDNQVTLVYRKLIPVNNPPLSYKDPLDMTLTRDRGTFVSSNMKIFHNGNVQITGLKYIEHGKEIMEMMIHFIKLLHSMGVAITENPDILHISNYAIQLINTDFRIGFDIKREKLYQVLVNKYPGIYKTYEPCIYPGVKIHYQWNTLRDTKHPGVCICHGKCKGKGSGHGNAECKRVTIAIFQSGCIIITGAHTQAQIEEAYEFINGVIEKHYQEVYKQSIEECLAKLVLTRSTAQSSGRTTVF